jgi:multidrug resistance efflux pump
MQVRFGLTQKILLQTSAVSQAVRLLMGSRPKPSLEQTLVSANHKGNKAGRMRLRHRKTIRPNAVLCSVDCSSDMGGGTGPVFSLSPPGNTTKNYAKVPQHMPVRIDFDCAPRQDFKAEGLLKPGSSVEPDVRVR